MAPRCRVPPACQFQRTPRQVDQNTHAATYLEFDSETRGAIPSRESHCLR